MVPTTHDQAGTIRYQANQVTDGALEVHTTGPSNPNSQTHHLYSPKQPKQNMLEGCKV